MTYFWLLLSSIAFGFGEYFSKVWAENGAFFSGEESRYLFFALLCYLTGSFLWFPALANKPSLAITGTLWSLLSLAVTVYIGCKMFEEPITNTQMVGLGVAGLAVLLLSL